MTSSTARIAAGALRALPAARTWRATVHVLTGLLVVTITALLALLWGAAVVALITGNTGPPGLTAVYAVVAVLGVVPLGGWLAVLSKVQRARFSAALGVEIPEPGWPAPGGRTCRRNVWTWRPPTWRVPGRQLGYHLLALFVIGPMGGALVIACWGGVLVAAVYPGLSPGVRSADLAAGVVALLAAPWAARGVAVADERVGRALLGPGPAEELARRVETLTRSRAEVVAAADFERRRVERDLHDGAQQRLVSLAMNLGMTRAAMGADVPDRIRAGVEEAHEEALRALEELRALVRGLHPAVLSSRGLDAALSGLVARAPLPVRLEVEVPERCAPAIEAIAYFTVSEALANVAKHAAAGNARVAVRRAGGRLRITVTDDGHGGARLDGDGTGLRGLAHRASAVDGWLRVDSPAGGPTQITVELPCA